MAFGGGGPHFCLGANLARMELRLIFKEMLTRIPDMHLVGDPEMLRSNFIGGIKHMPVEYTPGARGLIGRLLTDRPPDMRVAEGRGSVRAWLLTRPRPRDRDQGRVVRPERPGPPHARDGGDHAARRRADLEVLLRRARRTTGSLRRSS